MLNCPAQLLELIVSPCQLTVTRPAAVVTRRHAVGVRCRHLAGANSPSGYPRQVMLGGLVSFDSDRLRASCAVAALVRRPVNAADDKLPNAIARTDRVPLQLNRPRPAAVVTRRHAVGVRCRHLAGATRRQVARAGDARWVGVVDADRLGAGDAVATTDRPPGRCG